MGDCILGRPAHDALAVSRRCTATNRQGERCGKYAIPGGFVCAMHGGNKPTTRQAAQRRLLAMIEPALDALLRALRSAPPCPHCGRSDSDRDPATIRAAQLVLDRAGLGPTARLEVRPSLGDDVGDVDELLIEAERLVGEIRQLEAGNTAHVRELALDDVETFTVEKVGTSVDQQVTGKDDQSSK